MSTFVLSAHIEQLVEDPVGLPTPLMLAEIHQHLDVLFEEAARRQLDQRKPVLFLILRDGGGQQG